jgi:AhpD family alkylhydroperoxidase
MVSNCPEFYTEIFEQMSRLVRDIPQVLGAFSQLHRASTADGALSAKDKELIALGIAIAVRCEGCIVAHVHDALEAGAIHEEIAETIGVAIMMGGGPAVVYGCEAMTSMEQFEAELIPA